MAHPAQRLPERSIETVTAERSAGWHTRSPADSPVCPCWCWVPVLTHRKWDRAVPEEALDAAASQPALEAQAGLAQEPPGDGDSPSLDLFDRFHATFSQKEDPDGPINTDRPTFHAGQHGRPARSAPV